MDLQVQHQCWNAQLQGAAGHNTRSLSWLLDGHIGLAEPSITRPCCQQPGQSDGCGGNCKLPCRDALEKLRRQLPITASRLAAKRKAQAADSQLEAEQVGVPAASQSLCQCSVLAYTGGAPSSHCLAQLVQ